MQVPGYSRDQKSNSEQIGLKVQKKQTTGTDYATNLNNFRVTMDWKWKD